MKVTSFKDLIINQSTVIDESKITLQNRIDMSDKNKKAATFGKWKVDIHGNLDYDNYYDIDFRRLNEDDWIGHLSEKGWIDYNEFIPAYFQACKNANVQFVKIKMFY